MPNFVYILHYPNFSSCLYPICFIGTNRTKCKHVSSNSPRVIFYFTLGELIQTSLHNDENISTTNMILPNNSGSIPFRFILLFIVAVSLTACVNYQTLHLNGSNNELKDLNALAQDHAAYIILTNGQSIKAKELKLTSDSLYYSYYKRSNRRSVAVSEVQEIRFVNRGRGAMQGAGIGLLIGAVGGATLGYSSDGDNYYSAKDMALILGVLGGTSGGFLGIITGSLNGRQNRYKIIKDKEGNPD